MKVSERQVNEIGSISPLIMGYFVIVMSFIFVVANLASVYIARRDLINLSEGALSKAVQELDEFAYYYQVPIPDLFTVSQRRVPLNCSDAGKTFGKELAQLSNTETDVYGQSFTSSSSNIRIQAFICDGKALNVTLQQVQQLPFKLRVFGITEFTNEISLSMESIYQ